MILERESEVEDLKSDLKSAEEEIESLDNKLFENSEEVRKLEKELQAAKDLLNSYHVSPTDTIGNMDKRITELEEQNSFLRENCRKFDEQVKEKDQTIKDLRAKKNKAIVKRCLTTGQLTANFDSVEYQLIKK